MTPLRVLIADDERPARRFLANLLQELPDTTLVGEATNGQEAVALIEQHKPDLALLDLQMPELGGLDAARMISAGAMPAIAFVTAFDEFAVQAFELNAVDYLLKPVRAPRLAEALAKARRARQPSPEQLAQLAPGARGHFSVSERGRILLVPVAEVLYLKAELKYVTARTREREFLLDESLTHLEEELALRFVRVHRNCLVARAAIAGFERVAAEDGESHWAVLLSGLDEKLPVSRRQWPAVKAAFSGEAKC